MITATSLTAAAASIVGHRAQTTSLQSTSATTTYHRMTVDGVGVFYREAGPKNTPTIVLLHGFPSSSREFDTLIPLLATSYHLIAPDFPGFGRVTPVKSNCIFGYLPFGKRGCASTSRRFWWSGGGTIPRSSLPVRRRSSAICRMPKSTCSTPAILPWTRRTTTSRVLFSRSWPNIPSDRSVPCSTCRVATLARL